MTPVPVLAPTPTDHVTAPLAYFRFHGRNAPKWFGPDTSNEERYNYLYSDRELEPWAERIREGRQRRADVNAFAVMNNHFRGQAVANALQLQQMLRQDVVEVADQRRHLARLNPLAQEAARLQQRPGRAQRPLAVVREAQLEAVVVAAQVLLDLRAQVAQAQHHPPCAAAPQQAR